MYTTNLRKVGGSVMLAVPPALLDVLNLEAGSKVDLTVESGRLIVERRSRPRYTADELLAQHKPKRSRSKQERDWVSGFPVGRELI